MFRRLPSKHYCRAEMYVCVCVSSFPDIRYEQLDIGGHLILIHFNFL
jgi:hypothetical protein